MDYDKTWLANGAPPINFFFVIGERPEHEIAWILACGLEGRMFPIDDLDQITGYITSMPTIYLLPGCEKKHIWPQVKICIEANSSPEMNYRTVQVPPSMFRRACHLVGRG